MPGVAQPIGAKVFLASDAARMVSGATCDVTGVDSAKYRVICSLKVLAEPGTSDEKNQQEGGKHKPKGNEDEVTQSARPIRDSKAIFCAKVWVVVPCVVKNSAVFHISSPIPCVQLHARHSTRVHSRLRV